MPASVTYTFSANTKIKSAEMNQNFSDVTPSLITILSSAWTGATGSPSLGNGTWSADYSLRGKLASISISLIWGSTTSTAGTGAWIFNLPFTVSRGMIFAGIVFDNSTGNENNFIGRSDGGSTQIIRMYLGGGTTNAVGEGTPWAWATGDFLYLTGQAHL